MDKAALICPDCGGGMAVSARQIPPARLLTDWLAIDRGPVFDCPSCGFLAVVWPGKSLILKSFLALFCVWFGLYLAGTAFFILSIALGLPELFGFPAFETEITASMLAGAGLAASGAFLAFYAYPVDMARQLFLRWRLRRARARGRTQPPA